MDEESITQAGYDQTAMVFSPEGRMYQVEYARKVIERSPTTVGIVFKDGVVLVAKRGLQKLMVPNSIEKVAKVDNHIAISYCGILSDSRVLIDYARIKAQINRVTFGEPMEIKALTKDLSDMKQSLTQYGGVRLYGVVFLIGGYDDMPRLYETDPSGTIRRWKGHAVGRGEKKANEILEKNYKEDIDKETALKLAIEALKAGEAKLSTDSVDIGIIEKGTFYKPTDAEKRKLIKS